MTVTNRGYTDWGWYGKCNTCDAEPGARCLDRRKKPGGFVRYSDTPHKGRVKRVDHI